MKSSLRESKAQVVYRLYRDGNLEDPHIIDVQYPSDQDGLLLRDVKKRLATLRGTGMTDLFSWSYKRNYKTGFIWSDLSDYDVIHPLRGSGEYLVKASELIDASATRTNVHSHKSQVKKNVHSSIPSHATSPRVINESCHHITTPKQIHEPAGFCYSSPTFSRNLSFDEYKNLTVEQIAKTRTDGLDSSAQLERGGGKNHQRGGVISSRSAQMSEVLSDENYAVGALRSVKDKPSTLSVEQETIDLERSDFCLSSSDSETSPREEPVADIAVRGEALVIRTWSPSVVQGAESPALVSLGSPLCTPGGTRRLWKKDIKRSLFRTDQNLNSQVHAAGLVESIAIVDGARSTTRSNVSLYNGRSKSARVSGFNAASTLRKDEVEVTTPHSNLVKMLWARWTGGSKRRPIVVRSPGDTKNDVDEVSPVGISLTILKAAELRSLQSESRSTGEDKASNLGDKGGDHSLKEENICRSGRRPATAIEGNSLITATTEVTSSKYITPECKYSSARGVQQLTLDQSPDSVLLVKETSPASPSKLSQPQTPVVSPRTAIPRVRVRTSNTKADSMSNVANGIAASPGKGIPAGFHKGTNDTKPRITRKSTRSPTISASSPPSARPFKGNGYGCTSGRRTIFHEMSERNAVALGVPTGLLDQKAISFQERDERPLIPGLTILDWERTLEEVVKDSLPPPDFEDILQECSTCGRKFKPDSLKVHKRGCSSIRRARAFNTTPHIQQSQATPRLGLPEIMV